LSTAKVYRTPEGKDLYGIIAEFANPADIYHAAEKVRDAGYGRWDVYAPFPIHGIDEAMGLKRPLLPLVVAIIGLTMACAGFTFQYFVSGIDYPLIHQGKPPEAWQPYIPIIFEISILLAAFTALFVMLMLNGLPRWHHPLFRSDRFLRISQDRFAISIEAVDPKFDPHAARKLLESAGAKAVELVEDPS